MKILRISQFFSILVILFTSSCAKNQAPVEPSKVKECNPPIAWEIDFVLSGGFSGMARSLIISNNGNVIIEDLRNHVKRESMLSQDALGEIQKLLVLACPFEVAKNNSMCADCLNYNLRISMDDRQFRLQTNELNISDDVSSLLQYLNGIITK